MLEKLNFATQNKGEKMFKKLVKTECDGLQKTTIFYDKMLKRPYLLVVNNLDAELCVLLTSAEEVLANIKIYELRQKFTIEEIEDIKNYSKVEEKSNAEVYAKYGIKAYGGRRNNAGRKVGSLQKTPKTDRTERFTMAITKEEKEFLIKSLETFRKKHKK